MNGGLAFTLEGFDDVTKIGGGGFSTVYSATQRTFGRAVAIKVLDVGVVDDRTRRLFERECRTMGGLSSHPNIVTVHGSGFTDDGFPYLVMEYYEGGSCGDILRKSGPFSVERTIELGLQISTALAVAHERGVVHRDLKPDNILVSTYGQHALGDFGISAFTNSETTTSTETTSGLSLTPAHAAPEVLREERPLPVSDLYSFGSTLYTLLAGHPPFEAPSIGQLVVKVLTEEPRALTRSGLPSSLRDLVGELLEKDPSRRIGTAAELHEVLSRLERDGAGPLSGMSQAPSQPVELPEDLTFVPGELPPIVRPIPLSPKVSTGPDDLQKTVARGAAPVADKNRRFPLMVVALAVLLFAGGVFAVLPKAGNGSDDPEPDFVPSTATILEPAPDTPTGLRGTRVDSSTIRFDWATSPIAGTTYRVTRTDLDDPPDRVSDNFLSYEGLTPGTNPCISVTAIANESLSTKSAELCFE